MPVDPQAHPPLDLIRVLELLPAKSPYDPLRVQLSVESLNDAKPYEAVSYAWHGEGSPDTLRVEYGCNRAENTITANLAAALRQFRWRRRKRRLWVDAVSINQDDNAEKSTQVRLMGSIYKSATQVLVWLGPGTEVTKSALDDMRALEDVAKKYDVRSRSHTISSGAEASVDSVQAIEDASVIIRRGCFSEIFRNSWFSRIWIVQEVALARHVSIYWGSLTIDWDPLVHAMTLAKAAFEATRDISTPEVFTKAWNIVCIRIDFQIYSIGRIRTMNPLGDLILTACRLREQDCTDDRDRIYALLGLQLDHESMPKKARMREEIGFDHASLVPDVFKEFAWTFLSAEGEQLPSSHSDGDSSLSLSSLEGAIDRIERSLLGTAQRHPPLELEPNYDSSVTDVYTEFSWAYLNAQDEDILQACGLYQHNHPITDISRMPVNGQHVSDYLPSWSPDFRKPVNYAHTPWNGGNFRAGKGFLPSFLLSSEHKQVAGIHGVIFDRIVMKYNVKNNWSSPEEACHYFLQLVTGMQTVATVVGLDESYVTGGTFDEALSRTLVADGYFVSLWRDEIATLWDLYKRQFLAGGFVSHQATSDPQVLEQREKDFQEAWRYHTAMLKTTFGHSFFFTSKGYIGIASSMSQPGDGVMLIDGAQTPFVVRGLEGTMDATMKLPYHLIISPCYVHGVMNGESTTDGRYNSNWGYIPFI